MKRELAVMVRNQKRLLPVVAVCSTLFLLFYLLFLVFGDAVHNAGKQVDLENLVWWQRGNIFKEGVELPVVFLATVAYIALALFVPRFVMRSLLSNRWVLLLLVPVTLIIAGTRSIEFAISPKESVLGAIVVSTFLAGCYFLRTIRWGVLVASVVVFVLLVLFGMDTPSYFDYGFFIGPALKLSQGEPLGSFHMQYGVGMAYLVQGMMALDFRIPQMQVGFSLLTLLWFSMYYLLARRLIKDQVLVFFFMVTLLSYRYLAIYFDPIHTPATLPIRLDLWVLPTLVLLRFGVLSWVTALAFSITYVLDNTFGFFALVAYGGVVVFLSLTRGRLAKLDALKLTIMVLPVVGAVAFQLFFFGSIVNPAAKLYQDLRFGFMPIAAHSLFWVVLAILPYCVFILQRSEEKIRLLAFFILGVFLLNMTYFFGRSHDANLLGVLGPFVFFLFLTLDQLEKRFGIRMFQYAFATALIFAASILFSKYYVDRFSRVWSHLVKGRIVHVHPFDESIERSKGMFAVAYPHEDKILILSQFDAYINYRHGLRQVGEVVPFPIHIFIDETIEFVKKRVEEGYKVVFWEDEMVALVNQMNQRLADKKAPLRFEYDNRGGFFDLSTRIVP